MLLISSLSKLDYSGRNQGDVQGAAGLAEVDWFLHAEIPVERPKNLSAQTTSRLNLPDQIGYQPGLEGVPGPNTWKLTSGDTWESGLCMTGMFGWQEGNQ